MGSVKKHYKSTTIGGRSGKQMRLHRLVWAREHGEIPEGMVIDHIDGDIHNNDISNLRCVPQSWNVHNNHKAKGYRLLKGKYWQAYLKFKGKQHTRLCESEGQAKRVRRCLELIYLEGKL